jgi:hypothetical protein
MFIGTLIALWAVASSRLKRRGGVSYMPPNIPLEVNPARPPETWQYVPTDEFECTEAASGTIQPGSQFISFAVTEARAVFLSVARECNCPKSPAS